MTAYSALELEEGFLAGGSETATFGMGCFWGPDAMFGSLPGVIRTRTGYAGGTTPDPTYRKMGDHTETVEIDFDPAVLPYEELLRFFWANHYPNRDAYKGRQYLSLIRYRSGEQLEAIHRVKEEAARSIGEAIETEIAPFDGFTLAEERHQKYYLKRYPRTLAQLADLYTGPEELTDSVFAARLNGFVKGYGTREGLLEEIGGWPVSAESKNVFTRKLNDMKW
ncbi:peptide-methionine (S)-S-oxide reductase MsrA [Indiicoccus explosivorum]|uniref:peptide-methionine (S)-S-oxide reductase MsrA n=1 Tax=Indiicoccus explosivorum TaxID=1917864 RepID=UPI001F4DDF67|nr:peptide-methionine (S)-S-oxide reductase MsrA [Indiicoccus explosivorum]